jgi:Ankyrin repeats (3 copies)/Ankyrin repeats (many copies)
MADYVHRAALNGQEAVVDSLLKGVTSKAILLQRHKWLLHEVCEKGFVKVALQLLEFGFPLDGCDNDKQTPLHRAAKRGRRDVIGHLVQMGARLDAHDNKSQTALHVAVAHDEYPAARSLLHGRRCTSDVSCGRTPALMALERGHGDMARLLLQHSKAVVLRDLRVFFHQTPDRWPESSRDHLIWYLVDRRELLLPGMQACSPIVQEVVDGALRRFATCLSGHEEAQMAVQLTVGWSAGSCKWHLRMLRKLLYRPCSSRLPSLPLTGSGASSEKSVRAPFVRMHGREGVVLSASLLQPRRPELRVKRRKGGVKQAALVWLLMARAMVRMARAGRSRLRRACG